MGVVSCDLDERYGYIYGKVGRGKNFKDFVGSHFVYRGHREGLRYIIGSGGGGGE